MIRLPFSKIAVKGDAAHPLYKYLTGLKENGGEVDWNFNKFLISPEGKVVAHLRSKVEPMSDELKAKLERVMDENSSSSARTEEAPPKQERAKAAPASRKVAEAEEEGELDVAPPKDAQGEKAMEWFKSLADE